MNTPADPSVMSLDDHPLNLPTGQDAPSAGHGEDERLLANLALYWFLHPGEPLFLPAVFVLGLIATVFYGWLPLYLPELFPTKYRSTGTSFCYNAGRVVAAGGLFVMGQLTIAFASFGTDSFRYAGVTMCGVFVLGLLVLPFLPETKGKPLPE